MFTWDYARHLISPHSGAKSRHISTNSPIVIGAFASTRRPVISPEEAFAIPTYVLRHTMNGQIWPDGDELFHNWLMCPTLLIYGLKDQLVSLREEKDMEEVGCLTF